MAQIDSPSNFVKANKEDPNLSLERKDMVSLAKNEKERQKLRDAVKDLAKEQREKLAKSLDDHVETTGPFQSHEMIEQHEAEEVKKLAAEIRNMPETPTPAATPQSAGDKIHELWDRTKNFFSNLKDAGKQGFGKMLDFVMNDLPGLIKDGLDWLREHVGLAMSKMGMQVPDILKPLPKDMRTLEKTLKDKLKLCAGSC